MKEDGYILFKCNRISALQGGNFFFKGEFVMTKSRTVKLCVVGVMSALATVIYMFFPEIPLVPGVDYLKIDFSDMPAVLCGIMMGPTSGIAVEVIKNVIHLFRTTTVGIGELMNIGIGCAMILTVSLCGSGLSKWLKKDKLSPAVYFLSAAAGIAATILAGWVLNAVLTPVYFSLAGIPITWASVFAGVVGSTLLNTVKAAFNLLPFYPVYFALDKAFAKIRS